jgi:hypothetical protein
VLRRIANLVRGLESLVAGAAGSEKYLAGDRKSPKVLGGRLLARLNRELARPVALKDVEFQVFSQYGDDGLIQHFLDSADISPPLFLEFGVENYVESNTRFLLVNNYWRGLVIEANSQHAEFIARDPVATYYDLQVLCRTLTSENINDAVTEGGLSGPIGILSVDVDGMDYWLWRGLTVVDPAMVIVEYNSLFGHERAISVPYDPAFDRDAKHWSRMYWGASLAAFAFLADQRRYAFVGCNSAGNNAYFIKRDRLRGLRELPLKEGFVEAAFRERSLKGHQLRGAARREAIAGLSVVDVRTGKEEPF